MRVKKFIFLVLFLSCPVLAPAMGGDASDFSQDSLIGKPAPDAVLPKSDGTSGSVIKSRQGKKEILVFWATWCPHCYEEVGRINDVSTAALNKGIKIILVDSGENKEAVKNYLMQRQIKLNCFIDEENILQEPYQLIGVPTMFFIDEKGIIRNVTNQFPADYEAYFSN
jgi:peroxiredoxin